MNKKTNLNQLRILAVLLREPNLSRAAEILGLSQPTLSSALKQLRDEFGDPLLVRIGNKMEITAKGRSLVEPLEDIFAAVDQLWGSDVIEPQDVKRHFLVGCTDYGTAMLAGPLYNKLKELAPGITVQFVDVSESRRLINRENELDFYLVPDAICNSPAFQDYKYTPLFDDQMVYYVGANHPLADEQNVSEQALESMRFITYNLGEERSSQQTRRALSVMEMNRKRVLQVQQFSLLPMLADECDAVVILPNRLAEKLAGRFDGQILGPINPPIHFSFCLMWDAVHQSDKVHELIRDAFKSLKEAVANATPFG
ncbi:LysR family transcriptional regulator [Spongiibacter taiwanensis]|uniref:LysR family transcriptional regulator n=1 Tax=Spongiibacter taiwanensis TaxID=1748242 RepID=UPI00203516E7|nr:LysR family transcriptional regulator [Spongiibacter taiwanensis]USA42669.1 LysR family transcriptional regulator [Spongiibacter taiwanensis]